MRLIDVDELIKGRKENDPVVIAAKRASTIDAVSVIHGHWVDKGWDGDFSWHIDGHGNCWKVISCSSCGIDLCGSLETAYCPHCGAKMDLDV